MDNPLSSRANQSTKLPDVMKNVDNISPASSGNHRKQLVNRKVIGNEELVKYMSSLPSYLQKGENFKEKAFNLGVLDWQSLEKWQHNHKPISYQSSRGSPSSSNTSSFFSTDGSSSRSSRRNSFSPTGQRLHRKTLESYLNVSLKEVNSEDIKTIVENVGKPEDLKAGSTKPLKGQPGPRIFRMYQSFSKNQSGIKLTECERTDAEPQIIPETETSLDLKSSARSKGKAKIQDVESTGGLEVLHEWCCDTHCNYHERCNTVVLLQRNDPGSSHSVISNQCDLATVNGRRSTEASQKSFSEGYFPKVLNNADPNSEIAHACPRPCEDDNIEESQIKQPSSVEEKSIKFSSEPSQHSPSSVKMSTSPSRGKSLEERKSKVVPGNSTTIKFSEGSDLKKGTAEGSKSRKPSPTRSLSPTRRFINSLGRIGRSSSSKDSSEYIAAKHGSEKAVAASCSESSRNDKPNGKSRSQSSPLRRLLDPLLKPKAANSHQFTEPTEKDPTSADSAYKSSNGRVESSVVQSVKVKLDLKNCETINVDESHQNKKHGSATVQALLQIAIKNGLPLFTFAVDNSSDVLAATMRKVTAASKKDHNCWIYTFFTVHEVKKKNSWINQGGKGKSRGYIPNVVAQMTVSDSKFPNLVRHGSVDEFGIREFVLFAMDLKQAEHQTPDLQPNDELAAIVVKLPKDSPTEIKKEENGFSVRSEDLLSTTVILPGGVHGLPSKGEPSPLIKRWKLGGSCDCGGWDLGCRLTVLSNQTKHGRSSSSSETGDRFELFSKGEVVDNRPLFSLSPFKDGIFSVEFNSSMSFLQVFSICISVLNSRKPYELSELSKLFEEKSSEETALVVNDGIKAVQLEEVPASYASYPPISPFGRV